MRILKPRRQAGWSLVELTIILIVLSILCAILMPVIGRFVRNAKICRAREDIGAIGMSMWMYINDTANSYFLRDGAKSYDGGAFSSRPFQGDNTNVVVLLVSDGDIPHLGPGGNATWVAPVDFDLVDFFEYHLVTNRPGNDVTHRYRTPLDLTNNGADPMFSRDSSGGFNSEFAWRGPYITAPIDPDPWGNRYMSNVAMLNPVSDSDNTTTAIQAQGGLTFDCIVVTAGPDEEIETDYLVDGLTPDDDDLMITVSANSRP